MVKYGLNTKDPNVRKMHIDEYTKLGIVNFEKKWEMSARVVREWKKLETATGSTKPNYGGVGRYSILSQREVSRMERYLIQNPFATNADLANYMNNKISAREA